jgi:hypothetical protein
LPLTVTVGQVAADAINDILDFKLVGVSS